MPDVTTIWNLIYVSESIYLFVLFFTEEAQFNFELCFSFYVS